MASSQDKFSRRCPCPCLWFVSAVLVLACIALRNDFSAEAFALSGQQRSGQGPGRGRGPTPTEAGSTKTQLAARVEQTPYFATVGEPTQTADSEPAAAATTATATTTTTTTATTTTATATPTIESTTTMTAATAISATSTANATSVAVSPPKGFTKGPDPSTKPDYENIHGPLGKTLDDVFLWVFRTKLAGFVGVDSDLPKKDYQGLLELTAALNARYSDREEIQKIAQNTLRSLFPSWLPGQFAILFARPFPEFSSRMNAWATYVAGTWLMGECEVNDIEIDGRVYKDQGLLVKRCRFLEESGCASVCVNSCKIPTQNFFAEDMGLPLTMTPDYETHECQFAFGRPPDAADEFDAKNTPCLSRCPTAGSMRQWHSASGGDAVSASASGGVFDKSRPVDAGSSSKCVFMENSSELE